LNGTIQLTPNGSVTGGIGAADICSGEVTGMFSIVWKISVVNSGVFSDKFTVKLDLYASARVLVFVKKFALINCEWDILNNKSDCMGNDVLNTFDMSSQGFELMSRDYLNTHYEFVPNKKFARLRLQM